jgi:hypothetical protein
VQVLRAEGGRKVPLDYEEQITKAELTFCHQRIYDIQFKKVTSLTPLPHNEVSEEWNFLGPLIADEDAKLIATGKICPISRIRFIEPEIIVNEDKENEKSKEIFQEQKAPRTSIKYKEDIQSTLNRINLKSVGLAMGNLPPYHFINESKPRSSSSLLNSKRATTSIRQQIVLPVGQKSIKDFFIPKANKS